MFEAKLTIDIPGLGPALEQLAAAIAHRDGVPHATVAANLPTTSVSAPMPPSLTATSAPTTPVPLTPTTPVPQVPAAAPPPAPSYTPGPAPTAPPPGYTHEQVGKAGADLIAANPTNMPELLTLLQQFGVPAITELMPEQLGPFATALRGLGAKI